MRSTVTVLVVTPVLRALDRIHHSARAKLRCRLICSGSSHAIALLACVVLLLLPAAAAAQSSRDLWATVNVCDTAASSRTRSASAPRCPASSARRTLRMRFRVQYLAPDGRWLTVRRNADSGWQNVGARRGGRVESGWSFTFAPPESATSSLRGVVDFQWRRAGKVLRRAREITEDGHVSTAGADPPGFSAGDLPDLGRSSEQPRVVGDHAGHAERLRGGGCAPRRRPSTRRARRPRRRPPRPAAA